MQSLNPPSLLWVPLPVWPWSPPWKGLVLRLAPVECAPMSMGITDRPWLPLSRLIPGSWSRNLTFGLDPLATVLGLDSRKGLLCWSSRTAEFRRVVVS